MNKKEILLGIFSGFLANIVGTIFSVIILFQEIKISNILRILSNSISNNFITKLISLGAVMNLIVFFIFLRYDYEEIARGVLVATFIIAILTIYLNKQEKQNYHNNMIIIVVHFIYFTVNFSD